MITYQSTILNTAEDAQNASVIGLQPHHAKEPGAKARRFAVRQELERRLEKAPLISRISHDLEIGDLGHVFENFHGRVRDEVLRL